MFPLANAPDVSNHFDNKIQVGAAHTFLYRLADRTCSEPEVLEYLQDENRFTAQQLQPTNEVRSDYPECSALCNTFCVITLQLGWDDGLVSIP